MRRGAKALPDFFSSWHTSAMTTEHLLSGIAQTIQVAVAPVFLLTGLGALLGVLTNRLARIVDRARNIDENRANVKGAQAQAASHELGRLMKRIKLINWAISLSTLAELLVCLVIACLFLGDMLSVPLEKLIATLFIATMLAMVIGLICFLREIYLAIGMVNFNKD